MSTIGRPRVAVAYIWITFFVSGTVFIQGFLFGAFYSGRGADYIQFHGWVGEDAAFITIVLVVLAFWARFPGELRVGWWTLGWSILWNVQPTFLGGALQMSDGSRWSTSLWRSSSSFPGCISPKGA
jgi:hypothetical protein